MQSRRDVQRKADRSRVSRIIRWILIVIVVVLLAAWLTIAIANHPKNVARRQATTIARKYGGLKSRTGFYIYNREKTYYTVSGKNAKGQNIFVIVSQKGGDVRVVKAASGITSSQAINKVKLRHPKKVLKAAPGIFNGKVVWEVTYVNRQGSLCYDLINFKTGKYVQQIDNL